MRLKLLDDIQNIFDQGKTWISLEISYAKLTLAEKMTLLLTTLIIGFICALMGFVVIILFSFALVELFKLLMCPALAYVTVGGIILLCLVLLWLFREPLLLNPLARMLTRILITPHTENEEGTTSNHNS